MVYGWITVSHADGEEVADYEGDIVETDALHDLAHLIVKGQRDGKFEHDGDVVSEVRECIVLDKALQDALGIDLGKEGVLIGQYFEDDDSWNKAKTGTWEMSMAVEAQGEEI